MPPGAALTGLLANGLQIRYLTCVGLRLLCDAFDVNGLAEAIRIHPTLQSILLKDCWFSSNDHLQSIQQAVIAESPANHRRPRRKIETYGSVIVDIPAPTFARPGMSTTTNQMTTPTTSVFADNAFWNSWCLHPLTCCLA